MPLFKQERTVTIYAEADSWQNLTFGTTVDKWDEPKETKYKILHWSEDVKLAQEIQKEEYDKVHENFKKNMKCPSEK